MKLFYDIDQIERDYRAAREAATAKAMEGAKTDRERRMVFAQSQLAEATIIQNRVLMTLLNERADQQVIATAFAGALGNIFRTLISQAPNRDEMAEVLLQGVTDPGSLGKGVMSSFVAEPVMGGRA